MSKLLFALLLVLVVLFVFGIVAGQRGKGSPLPKPSVSDLSSSSLDSLFSAPLDLRDLKPANGTQAQCLQASSRAFTIPANRSCVFIIAQSAMPTRKLGLSLQTAGVTVDVSVAQNNKKTLDTIQHLPDDEPVELNLFNADDANRPATLTLTCRATPARDCRVVTR
ncbi:MAG TPA: hypothetical protein VGK87_12205 [Anaerolineae bacterium]|jgi:hypothetical protein